MVVDNDDAAAMQIIPSESQHSASASPHIWRGPPISNYDLPECDILSYVFGAYGQYDLDKPVSHFPSLIRFSGNNYLQSTQLKGESAGKPPRLENDPDPDLKPCWINVGMLTQNFFGVAAGLGRCVQ